MKPSLGSQSGEQQQQLSCIGLSSLQVCLSSLQVCTRSISALYDDIAIFRTKNRKAKERYHALDNGCPFGAEHTHETQDKRPEQMLFRHLDNPSSHNTPVCPRHSLFLPTPLLISSLRVPSSFIIPDVAYYYFYTYYYFSEPHYNWSFISGAVQWSSLGG